MFSSGQQRAEMMMMMMMMTKTQAEPLVQTSKIEYNCNDSHSDAIIPVFVYECV